MPQRPDVPGTRTSLFLTPHWFDLLYAHGIGAVSGRDDACIGQLRLPLLRDGRSFRALANYYTARYGPSAAREPGAEDMRQLAQWFRHRGASDIHLYPVLEDATWLPALLAALRQRGYACDTYLNSINWYLPCAGMSGEQYVATRPSRLRNTIRRSEDKLSREPGYALRIVEDDDPQALAAYHHVYARSWKSGEPFAQFIPELCQLAARAGWLRLGLLYLGGEAVAAQIWFVKDGTASIYKLAYDAAYARRGVGTVLTAALARHVLDRDHVSEIDFLLGNDPYKAEWMSHSRQALGLVAFNLRSPAGLLRAARHFGGKALRRWIKPNR